MVALPAAGKRSKDDYRATWFQEIENIILTNSYTRKVKEEFKIQGQNVLALMPQHISPWVKYAKGEMKLELEPDYFINRSEGSSISSEKVRSLRDNKEEIRVVIEEPSLELIDRIVEGQEKRQELKEALVKSYSEDKQNERVDQIAKEGGETNVLIKVKQVMTKSIVFLPVWKEIEIECSPRKFIKQLLMTATRAEWTFNQGIHDEIHKKQAWAKKEEEILNSIKEDLKQKEKIDLEILSIAKEEVCVWIEQGVHAS
ncbi:30403_t:CDS:2 [Gigaspora margarita]|uniref:30403_t:CDS:1 n=1 Tax=Gigaspora margarita TaxID=4874 RepID=A0ABN7VHF0_GIGMA|nr:30403_t:CDS:2 [Gigaspora margarita]